MFKEIKLKDYTIKYNMKYKNVKNINLRIKSDGEVYVSANKSVPCDVIENFIKSKAEFIKKAQEKAERNAEKTETQYFSYDEICDVILKLCDEIYPYYQGLGVKKPVIKFRRMISQWGNCRSKTGVLTFNTNLMYAPIECIEYVVAHEFTHFLHPDHSSRFYIELAKIMPDWKGRREKLKEISIRK